MKCKFLHFVLAFSVVSCWGFAQQNPNRSTAKRNKQDRPLPLTSHLILVMIDGLRIEDFKNTNLNIPRLKAMRDSGALVLNLESSYPSQSLPAQATILTGMFPSDHGIVAEQIFDEKTGISSATEFGSPSNVQTETILSLAKRSGLSTAAIHIPFIKKADADYVSQDLSQSLPWLKKNPPHLLLVGFNDLGKTIERYGIGSGSANAALEKIDSSLQEIWNIFEQAGLANEFTFLVVSGHGYAKVEREFKPNVILARKGFLTLDAKGAIIGWKAAIRASGGAAAVYVKEPKNEELIKEVRTIFEDLHKQESSPIWRIVEKKDAMKIGADPNAAFFLEAAPGFLITEKATGKRLIEKLETNFIQAISGYLPSRSEMRGVLLAAGKGIRAKSQTEYARITDIVPTIARMLSLELKATRGHTISEIFVQE